MKMTFDRRPFVWGTALLLPSLAFVLLGSHEAHARGGSQGLRWGYHPSQGFPLNNLWRMVSPWAALNGYGIPHHSLEAPNLNMGSPQHSYGMHGSFSSSSSFPQRDRRSEFIGASSQTALAGSYSQVHYYPPPDAPYRLDTLNQPPYYHNYNGYWLHGYWGGGQWGWSRWDPQLGKWGFPRWGVGPLYFHSGYGLYRNPFLSDDPAGARYALPIIIQPDEDGGESSTAADRDREVQPAEVAFEQAQSELVRSPKLAEGLKSFDAARDAFRSKDYAGALAKIDEALVALPHDPALHEFRGLVQFARGEYGPAAATVYAVLSVAPGWDWTTVSSFYGDADEYTQHLRQLETYRKQHPEEAAPSFLLGYHYVTCRHTEAAVKHFRNVAKLLPEDNLTPHLATLVTGAGEKGAASAATAEPQGNAGAAVPVEPPPPVDPAELVGTWHAQRGGSVQIELTLQAERRFVWVATVAGEARRTEGTYALEGNQLLLSSRHGAMIGVVTARPGGGFRFRLLENAPEESGLDFSK